MIGFLLLFLILAVLIILARKIVFLRWVVGFLLLVFLIDLFQMPWRSKKQEISSPPKTEVSPQKESPPRKISRASKVPIPEYQPPCLIFYKEDVSHSGSKRISVHVSVREDLPENQCYKVVQWIVGTHAAEGYQAIWVYLYYWNDVRPLYDKYEVFRHPENGKYIIKEAYPFKSAMWVDPKCKFPPAIMGKEWKYGIHFF